MNQQGGFVGGKNRITDDPLDASKLPKSPLDEKDTSSSSVFSSRASTRTPALFPSGFSSSTYSPTDTLDDGDEESPLHSHNHHHTRNWGILLARDLIKRVGRIHRTLKRERLPWFQDFLNREQFSFPKNMGEVMSRLNLNIPFFAANYATIFYIITLPYLLWYNPMFFLFSCVSAVLLHSIHLSEKKRTKYGTKMRICGVWIMYERIADILIILLLVLLVFWNGLRTLISVLLINSAIIVPHAALRRPTLFDDEELEKLRPKVVQYIIILVLLLLAYIECKGSDGVLDKSQHHHRYNRNKKKEEKELEQKQQ